MNASPSQIPDDFQSVFQEVLFASDKSAPPVFSSPSDLAAEMYGLCKGRYKDPASLLATLSPVLRRKRASSTDFRDLILAALKERTESRGDSLPLKTFERLSEALAMSVSGSEVRCDRSEFASLLRQVRSAGSLVGLAPPAVLSNPCGRDVFRSIVQRLQQLDREGFEGKSEVWLLCPSIQGAKELWRELILQWQSTLCVEPETAYEALNRLEGAAKLHVLAVPEESCLFPAILIEPSDEHLAAGFHLELLGSERVSIGRMSSESCRRWNNAVFLNLKMGRLGNVVSVEGSMQ